MMGEKVIFQPLVIILRKTYRLRSIFAPYPNRLTYIQLYVGKWVLLIILSLYCAENVFHFLNHRNLCFNLAVTFCEALCNEFCVVDLVRRLSMNVRPYSFIHELFMESLLCFVVVSIYYPCPYINFVCSLTK